MSKEHIASLDQKMTEQRRLDDRLDRLEAIVSQLPERFENLKARLELMDRRFDQLETLIRNQS